jgi:hypothetical protein
MPTDTGLQTWLNRLEALLVGFGQTGFPAWVQPTAVVLLAGLARRVVARRLRAWLFGFLLGWRAGTGYWTQLAPWLELLWRSGWTP